METESKDLKQEVETLLKNKCGDNPLTGYQLNKATGINLSTCNQIINGTWNPTWRTLIEFKERFR